MSRERLDFPLDRNRALRLYDELREEAGVTDLEVAARRIGIAPKDLKTYVTSRAERESRKKRESA